MHILILPSKIWAKTVHIIHGKIQYFISQSDQRNVCVQEALTLEQERKSLLHSKENTISDSENAMSLPLVWEMCFGEVEGF